MKKKTNYKWLVRVVLISVVASMVFTVASSEIIGHAGYAVALVTLALFIAIGVAFDIIGVAVTAAQEAPFHAMAAHRERGASDALKLIKNADRTASICNDVVGDVTGIVSGSTAALLAARLIEGLGSDGLLFPLLISGVVTGLMICGKAVGKTFAINHSTAILAGVGKFIHVLRFRKNPSK